MDAAFIADLRRYGPDAAYPRPTPAAAYRYCRLLATRHYENFLVVSIFVPRPLRRHFQAIYAYCRWADDLADEVQDRADALRLLEWWRTELLSLYPCSAAVEPSRHPVMVALARTIAQFNIPATPFLNLLIAFGQDQRVRRYDSFAQLSGYCAHSANPVGHLVLYLLGEYAPEKAQLADEICTGLQLANFWQDVARDADLGRRYLPAEDLERFGYAESDWQARRSTPEFRALLRFQVERTHTFFERGRRLLDLVQPRFRPQLRLFIAGGEAILAAIARQNYDTWTQRPIVTKREQLGLLARAACSTLRVWATPVPSPHRHQPRTSLVNSYRYCECVARREARNFYPAFLLLPAARRRAMAALYAFMRMADDLADGSGTLAERRQRLQDWRAQLEAALNGQYHHPALPALADAIAKFEIDPSWLFDLLAGVESDLTPARRFPQEGDLNRYCYQVAGTVGLCCIRVWGCRAPEASSLAEAGGRAFQMTNILRDVRDDFACDRIYFPLSDLEAAGVNETELLRNPGSAPARQIYRELARRAHESYAEAQRLSSFLPTPGRAAWELMRATYRGLLEQLEERDFDPTLPRVRLSRSAKARLLAAGVRTRFLGR